MNGYCIVLFFRRNDVQAVDGVISFESENDEVGAYKSVDAGD
jgi:hypothetical protein